MPEMHDVELTELHARVRAAHAAAREAVAIAARSRSAAEELNRATKSARRRRWTIRYERAFLRKSVELRSELDVDLRRN